MTSDPAWLKYPGSTVSVYPFPDGFWHSYPEPPGYIEDVWPPIQLKYLSRYLEQLDCHTIVMESHYVDRDYMDDFSLFYARSLRNYPSYCSRLHFFQQPFDEGRWRSLVAETNGGHSRRSSAFLDEGYLGFSVIRPLPGTPVGRTVLRTFPRLSDAGHTRHFGAVRPYKAHLAGLELHVVGLPFQQQDQGVSACATMALWSAIHSTAALEELTIPTPADITEAASRYLLTGGRPLPSEGLDAFQICEAIRSSGLAPLLINGDTPAHDQAQLYGYMRSGFSPILALLPLEGSPNDGHAVCSVGLKLGDTAAPGNIDLGYRDAATAVQGIYIHDDRLGPYAVADLFPHTMRSRPGQPRTGLTIRWPGEDVPHDSWVLSAIVVPLPTKVRLTIARMRGLGDWAAQVIGSVFPALHREIVLDYRYERANDYRARADQFGLSDAAFYTLACEKGLPRYLGLLEFSAAGRPIIDVLLDATESSANPAVLACVQRTPMTEGATTMLQRIAGYMGTTYIA